MTGDEGGGKNPYFDTCKDIAFGGGKTEPPVRTKGHRTYMCACRCVSGNQRLGGRGVKARERERERLGMPDGGGRG